MVSGDIDELPVPPEPAPGPIEADAFEVIEANEFAEFSLTPVDGVDDFDDASALRASMADDAAPRAKNMAELQHAAQTAADRVPLPAASAVPPGKTQ
ncbi:hypothetical protein [Bradyrhizobium sp. CCBAU 051011]|uniref:hypothetical protein n=1 Tax=Bradyrhizobium sp. CCBAU 051011 TaxID=858422 RepID=UPI00352B823F